MASDMFLKLGDIKGESGDDSHKDEIEVVAWQWGIQQQGSMGSGGGGGTGKADFADLTITHRVDKATPNLMKLCATLEHVGEATLTLRKAGKKQEEFVILKMNDVAVTGVHPSGNGSGEVPLENFTLQFAKVDFEYKPQKSDGTLDAGIHFKYDIKATKEG